MPIYLDTAQTNPSGSMSYPESPNQTIIQLLSEDWSEKDVLERRPRIFTHLDNMIKMAGYYPEETWTFEVKVVAPHFYIDLLDHSVIDHPLSLHAFNSVAEYKDDKFPHLYRLS